MYTFRTIRAAILAAEPPAGFPFGGALSPERLPELRAAPHLRALLDEIRARAGRAAAEPIPPLPFALWRLFEDDGTRLEFERPYFDRRGRLLALALAATIDAGDRLIAPLEDTIWSICDEYSWSLPAHLGAAAGPGRTGRRTPPEAVVDLFAAETAHALSETLALLGGRLSPWIGYRVRAEIERRVFQPLFHDPAHLHWESAPMNWAAVCAGAAGMAALLLEADRERLAGMVERCARALEVFLEGYGADGGCAEGIGYWQYGFGYYTYFAEMLREYTGGALDLLAGERIAKIAAFPAGVSLSGGCYVNYSDGEARTELASGLVSRLAARTGAPAPALAGVPSLHSDDCYRWPHVVRNLIWTDPAQLGRPTPDGTVLFDHLGWVVDRRTLSGAAVAFSAKGGHNAEPHNQNDLGHFILHVGGESLLCDLGAGVYTREYFGPQRYEHLHNGSAGHSVPLIDSQTQRAGLEHSARVIERAALPDGARLALDLAGAYAVGGLRGLTREFTWAAQPAQARARLTLIDTFAFDEPPGALEEILISLHPPELAPGRATWRGARGAVTLSYDPARLRATTEAIPNREHSGRPIVVQRLHLALADPRAAEQIELTFDVTVS